MIPFVDAHIRYDWLSPPFSDDGPNGSVEPIARDYGVADYRADLARWNVVGAVHVDAGAAAESALRETQWLDGLASVEGLPTGLVAFAALNDPDLDALLTAQAAHPRVKGIRHIINWHANPDRSYGPTDLTVDPAWQAGYKLLAKHGLSFDLQCYPGQMPGLAPLIESNPDIPVIINHMGMPVLTDSKGLEEWRQGMAALAALPHVSVKISGMGFIRRDWDQALVEPLVRETIELFGTQRCMFASDTPTDKLFGPIDRYMEAYHAIVLDFPLSERHALFSGNANRIYRLGLSL